MADPYKDKVVLYLPFEGSRHGDTNILDKTGKTVTVNETAALNGPSSVAEPFGSTHLYCDGERDYVSFAACPDFDFGAGDWTIEGWILKSGTGDREWIAQRHSSDINNFWFFRCTSTHALRFVAKATSTITDITTTTTLSLDTWYHVAAVRRSGLVSIFVNGVLQPVTTTANSASAYVQPNYPLLVGAADNSATADWLGYIKDLRVTKGVARYTGNFSVSQTTTVEDDYWANVVLAIHGEGTGTTFTDVSNSPQTITTVGGATHSTAVAPPFGTSSIKFDGDADALLVATGSWWDVGTSNFTIETWIYVVAGVTNASRIFQSVNGDVVAGLYITMSQDGTLNVAASSAGSSFDILNTSGGTLSTGKWYHIAWVREGSNFNFFINGIKTFLASSSSAIYYSGSHQPVIGGQSIGTSRSLNGYLKDFRFTKGVARYTQNFNPLCVVDPYYKNTVLLISGEGSGTTFVDYSPIPKPITLYYNTTHSTAVNPPFGSSSIYFDGTQDWLSVPKTSAFNFSTNNFTIEMWVYLTQYTTTSYVRSIWSTGKTTVSDHYSTRISVNDTNKLYATFSTNGTSQNTLADTVDFPLNTWVHVALERYNGNITLYKDGNVVTYLAIAASDSIYYSTADPVSIAQDPSFGGAGYDNRWKGYMKNIVVINGDAKYKSTFIPIKAPTLINSNGRPIAFPDKTAIKTIAKPLDWDSIEPPRILI